MISPKEAYLLVEREHPGECSGIVTDFDNCYLVSNDILDTDYKVDKQTGKVSIVWIDELIELMRPYDPDDNPPKTYHF